MQRLFNSFVAISFVFALGACGDTENSAQKAAAYVSTEDGITYTSTFFDINLDKPENWVSNEQSIADKMLNLGSDMVAGDDKTMKANLDLSLQRTLAICVFSRDSMEKGRTDNALFLGIAENVRIAPDVKNGADYFDQMKILARSSGVSVSYSDTYSETMIDGQTFGTMTATYAIAGMDIPPQKYYAARHKDHVIVFIATVANAEDRQAAESIIDSIKLDW